jgi:hypothetical protein
VEREQTGEQKLALAHPHQAGYQRKIPRAGREKRTRIVVRASLLYGLFVLQDEIETNWRNIVAHPLAVRDGHRELGRLREFQTLTWIVVDVRV